MSTIVSPSTNDSSREDRLKQHLFDRVENGEMYFESEFITDGVGLSPKEIDALTVKLRNSATDLSIERWSYTSAATWCARIA